MKEISYRQVAFVVLCSLFFLPCHANYVADNDPTFRLSCATPDSMDISQLNLYNTEVKHGYVATPKKTLNYDEVYKIAITYDSKKEKSMSQIMVNAIITYYSSNTILECILMER